MRFRVLLHGLSRAAWRLPALLVPGGLVALAWPDACFVFELAREPAPAVLPAPVAGVAARAIGPSFGAARSGGRRHEGVDVFAPRGRTVVATTRGLVWRVGTDPLGGNVVWVLGPGRELHDYAHLDTFADVRAGERIAQCTALGTVGTTSNAKGGPSHLHYGIHPAGGRAIDPWPRLACARCPARTAGGTL